MTKNQNMGRKALTFLPVFLLALCLVFIFTSCGGSDPGDAGTSSGDSQSAAEKNAKRARDSRAASGDAEDDEAVERGPGVFGEQMIENVTLSPEIISATTPLSVEVETVDPLDDSQSLAYTYMRNHGIIAGREAPELPAGLLKKDDTYFVKVEFFQDGKLKDYMITPIYQVVNSPPEITGVEFPTVRGPGTYEYKVKAEDPDADEKLSYSMETDRPELNPQMDENTGVITLTLGDRDEVPESVSFTVTVKDGSGGTAKKVATQNFFKRPGQPEQDTGGKKDETGEDGEKKKNDEEEGEGDG